MSEGQGEYGRVRQTLKDRFVSSLRLLDMTERLITEHGTEAYDGCARVRLKSVADEYRGILMDVFAVSKRELKELETIAASIDNA